MKKKQIAVKMSRPLTRTPNRTGFFAEGERRGNVTEKIEKNGRGTISVK